MAKLTDKDREKIAKLKEDDVGLLVFKDDKEIVEHLKNTEKDVDSDGLPIEKILPGKEKPAPTIKGMPGGIPSWKNAWQDFYLKVWKMKLDFSDLEIPPQVPNAALVIVANGLNAELIVEKFRAQQKIASLDLNFNSVRSCRETSKKSYAIWLKLKLDLISDLIRESSENQEMIYQTKVTAEEELLWRMLKKHKRIADAGQNKDEFVVCLGTRAKGRSMAGFPKMGIRSSKSIGGYYNNDWGDDYESRTVIRKGGFYLNIFPGTTTSKEKGIVVFTRSAYPLDRTPAQAT